MIRMWRLLRGGIVRQTKLSYRLFRDTRVPMWQKAIPLLPIIYILSPLNLWSFAIPFFGQIDDVSLILAALWLFEKVVDQTIVEEHREK